MKNIIIRKVKSEDAEQYIKLGNLVWRIAYRHIFPEEVFIDRESKEQVKIKEFDNYHYNNEKRMVYVAEENSKIVGFVLGRLDSGYPYYDEKGFADLESLYIHPDYQGYGIATTFKNMFENWAKEKGSTKYVIGVLKENHNARKVYEKWGGKLDEYTQPFVKLGIGYDEVFYTYDLEREQ